MHRKTVHPQRHVEPSRRDRVAETGPELKARPRLRVAPVVAHPELDRRRERRATRKRERARAVEHRPHPARIAPRAHEAPEPRCRHPVGLGAHPERVGLEREREAARLDGGHQVAAHPRRRERHREVRAVALRHRAVEVEGEGACARAREPPRRDAWGKREAPIGHHHRRGAPERVAPLGIARGAFADAVRHREPGEQPAPLVVHAHRPGRGVAAQIQPRHRGREVRHRRALAPARPLRAGAGPEHRPERRPEQQLAPRHAARGRCGGVVPAVGHAVARERVVVGRGRRHLRAERARESRHGVRERPAVARALTREVEPLTRERQVRARIARRPKPRRHRPDRVRGHHAPEPREPHRLQRVGVANQALRLAVPGRQRRPVRVREPQQEVLRPLVDRVVENGHPHRLERLARREDERARIGRVVRPRPRRRDPHPAARAVRRRPVHRHRMRYRTVEPHREHHRLVASLPGDAPLRHDRRGGLVVVGDRHRGARGTAQRVAAAGRQRRHDGAVRLIRRVVHRRDRERRRRRPGRDGHRARPERGGLRERAALRDRHRHRKVRGRRGRRRQRKPGRRALRHRASGGNGHHRVRHGRLGRLRRPVRLLQLIRRPIGHLRLRRLVRVHVGRHAHAALQLPQRRRDRHPARPAPVGIGLRLRRAHGAHRAVRDRLPERLQHPVPAVRVRLVPSAARVVAPLPDLPDQRRLRRGQPPNGALRPRAFRRACAAGSAAAREPVTALVAAVPAGPGKEAHLDVVRGAAGQAVDDAGGLSQPPDAAPALAGRQTGRARRAGVPVREGDGRGGRDHGARRQRQAGSGLAAVSARMQSTGAGRCAWPDARRAGGNCTRPGRGPVSSAGQQRPAATAPCLGGPSSRAA